MVADFTRSFALSALVAALPKLGFFPGSTIGNLAPGAAALQFSMKDPRVASTIVGVSKPERVTQTLNWAAAPISPQVWDAVGQLDFETEDPEAHRVYRPG